MVDAVLAGDGLERVAELAAEAVGGTVAIVVPRLGAAVIAPTGTPAAVAWTTAASRADAVISAVAAATSKPLAMNSGEPASAGACCAHTTWSVAPVSRASSVA